MELGSNFDLSFGALSYVEDSIFSYLDEYDAIYTDNGRSALRLLSDSIRPGRILVPEYICVSVITSLSKNLSVVPYELTDSFEIKENVLEQIDERVSAIYIMHYFGVLQNEELLNSILKKCNQYSVLIIEDTTHSIFTKKRTIGDYCVCSLRKWFPTSGGAIYGNDLSKIEGERLLDKVSSVDIDAAVLKHYYIQGEANTNMLYRHLFNLYENGIDTESNFAISGLSKLLLRCFSVSDVIEKRKSNAEYLFENLHVEYSVQKSSSVYYTLPILLNNRDEIRKRLMRKRIYCAVHWPEADMLTEHARRISRRILSLPIDQRYGHDEMGYLVNSLKEELQI